ncbi:MAG: polyprenyl diphosphate synthase [bacterium]|nr:polyprenyl diphosphate synthase [bacterium]
MEIPSHIGYIVDGNRRWARARNLPTLQGHKQGFEVLKSIVEVTFSRGVKFVSAYIFSTENWNRSAEEVKYLMNLFENYFSKEIKTLHEKNIKVVFSGSRVEKVSKKLVKIIERAEELTRANTGGTLCLCFNYGGQMEILDAVKSLAEKIEKGEITAGEISKENFEQNLYNPEIPPIDLMVRTSGEQRISNFQLWRMAYAEMIFLDKSWPEMTEQDVDFCIENYNKRDRRMGGDSKK